LRSSVTWLLFSQETNLNGPVPTGAWAKPALPSFLTAAGLTMDSRSSV
jgi:hypothetical protein